MTRKVIFNLFFALIFAIIIASACSSPDKERPNIIFVLVDDLGWRDVGFMGSSFYETPNIDRIADEGIIFTNAYAACAVCSPTRSSILTGRYPARTGITDWIRGSYSGITIPADMQNPTGYDTVDTRKLLTPKNPNWMELEETTIAELVKQKGYVTGHIGKWHLGLKPWYPEQQGFDFNIGGTDFGQPPTYFDPYKRGKFSIENLAPRKEGEYLTDREGDEAVKFIHENQDNPFFLYLCNYAVHTPLQAKEELINKYSSKSESDTTLKKWIPETDEFTARFGSRVPLDDQRNPTYAAMIESVDDAVGKILNTLEELDLDENTIVIFFSDNGGHIVSTDNSPLRLGKGHPYEGGIRVPLAIRWPENINSAITTDVPVTSVDFLPTLMSILNIKTPADIEIDGSDLTPILTQKADIDDRNIYWHFPHYWWGTKVTPYSIIRSGEWKLIKNWEDNSYELYNLNEDLSEETNCADENKDIVVELNRELENWFKEVNAKLPVINPNFKSN